MSDLNTSKMSEMGLIVPSHGNVRNSRLRAFIEKMGNLAESIAAFLVLMIAALICYEVVARYLFGNPTGFANQMAAYAMPFIAFLAAAATLGKNAHVAVDVLVNLLSEMSRLKLRIFTEALSVALLAAVTWMAVLEVHDNWISGTKAFSTVLTFPEYIPQIIMPIGLMLLTCYQVLAFVDTISAFAAQKQLFVNKTNGSLE